MAPLKPPALDISPPLLNSANPWATTLEHLKALYECESTGAVTTRTSLIDGFDHDPNKHQFVFFDTATHGNLQTTSMPSGPTLPNASLNSLGYSPIPLDGYLDMIKAIAREQTSPATTRRRKWFIVSVTGTPDEVAGSYAAILAAQRGLPHPAAFPLAMEVNLSCPNIPGKPPPAYSGAALGQYLAALSAAVKHGDELYSGDGDGALRIIAVGLKTPPYTHAGQFETLVSTLAAAAAAEAGGVCPVSFLTATNTLGSCLVVGPPDVDGPGAGGEPALPGLGIGGMAGAPLHPLALGNVATLRRMLDARPAELGHVQILGVGGVADAAGYRRMRAAGAVAVGVGTALGLRGTDVFGEIEKGVGGKW